MAAYKVILTPEALADLQGIHSYIAADSPDNAARVIERLLDGIDSLSDIPRRFAIVQTQRALPCELRALVVRPYRVLYSIEGEGVFVRTIRDGRRAPWP